MSKPSVHCLSSARKFGGVPSDYWDVHQFLDSSKSAHATVKHRAVFHTVEGCALAVRVLGPSTPNAVPTAAVCDQHVREDMGRVVALSAFLSEIAEPLPWMRRPVRSSLAHAESDVSRYGGSIDDYRPVHELVDRVSAADPLARLVLHHCFGCFVVERALGPTIVNSSGRTVHVRDLVEQHVLRELGRIPDLGDWLAPMRTAPWMAGARANRKDLP